MQFISMLDNVLLTLSQLNMKWQEFVTNYNNRPHSALKDAQTGKVLSPMERYRQDMKTYRYAPPEMPRHFRYSETRLVSAARSISFNNTLYQVPIGYAGKKLEIRYFRKDGEIEAFFGEKSLGILKPVDLRANALAHRLPDPKGGAR